MDWLDLLEVQESSPTSQFKPSVVQEYPTCLLHLSPWPQLLSPRALNLVLGSKRSRRSEKPHTAAVLALVPPELTVSPFLSTSHTEQGRLTSGSILSPPCGLSQGRSAAPSSFDLHPAPLPSPHQHTYTDTAKSIS